MRTRDCADGLACQNQSVDSDNRACVAADAGCACEGDQWCTANGECVSGDFCEDSSACDQSCTRQHYCGGHCSERADCLDGEQCISDGHVDDAVCGVVGDCRCKSPQDVCVDGECVRPTDNCTFDGCPSGYACNTAYGCVCAGGPQQCEIPCSATNECSSELSCSDNNYCERQYCMSPADCPPGFVCGGDEDGGFCRRPGSLDLRATCTNSRDCESGYCRDGYCATACRRNSQCPDQQECVMVFDQTYHHKSPFCRAPECGDCAADEICDANRGECVRPCATNADCGSGESCHSGVQLPTCQPGTECTELTEQGEVTTSCATDELCDDYNDNGCQKPCMSVSECTARIDCGNDCPDGSPTPLCSNYVCKWYTVGHQP